MKSFKIVPVLLLAMFIAACGKTTDSKKSDEASASVANSTISISEESAPISASNSVNKTALSAPSNLAVSDGILTWTKVNNASSYAVDVDGTINNAISNTYSVVNFTEYKTYIIKVKAIGQGSYEDSLWSNTYLHIVAPTSLQTPKNLRVDETDGYLKFDIVKDATNYELMVDDEIVDLGEDTKFSLALAYNGVHVLKVRAVDAYETIASSQWAQVSHNVQLFSTNVVSSELEITGYKIASYKTHAKKLIIPQKINNVVVKRIGKSAFSYCYSLATITMEDDITYIGSSAFLWCSNLETVKLSENLYALNNYVFKWSGLKSIVVPNSVKYVESEVFYGCDRLASVVLPNDIADVFDNTFYNCVALTNVSIGSNVSNMGPVAFIGCVSLREVNINANNNNFKSVNGVIYSKDGSKLVYYPPGRIDSSYEILDSVTTIGNYAFKKAQFLSEIIMSNKITSIGAQAFLECPLYNITLSNTLTYLGGEAFSDCFALESIVLPDTLQNILGYTFLGCVALEEVTFGNNLKTIGNYAFSRCYNLKSVELPNTVTSVGMGAFSNCTSLSTVSISPLMTTIYGETFEGCTSLKIIDLLNVSSLGPDAFSNCTSLVSVTIRYAEGYVSVFDDTFWEHNEYLKVYIPEECYDDYLDNSFYGWIGYLDLLETY